MNDTNEFLELYKYMLSEFDSYGSKSLISKSYYLNFSNFIDINQQGVKQFKEMKNEKLELREEHEEHFHSFLTNQLFHRLQEIKYYSEERIDKTRRLIAVSPDCISTIQVLVREKIHIIVHFRSSDFDGALPADLKMISTIPFLLLQHMQKMRSVKGYEEVTDEFLYEYADKEVELSLSFGDVHRTA